MYGSWDMECDKHNFLPFYPSNNLKYQNFWNNEYNTQRYYHFTHVYCKWQSYDVWFLRYGVLQTESFVISNHFLHFYPLNNPKNENFEKTKTLPGDIIILHMCTINDNHMMYGSWDLEHDWWNFLSFWTLLCPFNPLTTRKIKILKNSKKDLEILSFYTCVP